MQPYVRYGAAWCRPVFLVLRSDVCEDETSAVTRFSSCPVPFVSSRRLPTFTGGPAFFFARFFVDTFFSVRYGRFVSTGNDGDTPKVDREAAKQAAGEMLQIEAELDALQYAERNGYGFPMRSENQALRLWKLRELRLLNHHLSDIHQALTDIHQVLTDLPSSRDPHDSRD